MSGDLSPASEVVSVDAEDLIHIIGRVLMSPRKCWGECDLYPPTVSENITVSVIVVRIVVNISRPQGCLESHPLSRKNLQRNVLDYLLSN